MNESISFIMTYIFRVALLLLSLAAYIFLTSRIYPKIFLKPDWNIGYTGDRGIKKYKFQNGRAIVYEPSLKMRKYIKQYILSYNDGQKYIKCKLDKRIQSIVYDVIAYNSQNKALDNIIITDLIEQSGYSRAAVLPVDTSYVTVIVKQVNGFITDNSAVASYSLTNVFMFFAVTVVTTVIEYLALRRELVFAAKLISMDLNPMGTVTAIVLSAIIGIISAFLILRCYWSKYIVISK